MKFVVFLAPLSDLLVPSCAIKTAKYCKFRNFCKICNFLEICCFSSSSIDLLVPCSETKVENFCKIGQVAVFVQISQTSHNSVKFVLFVALCISGGWKRNKGPVANYIVYDSSLSSGLRCPF